MKTKELLGILALDLKHVALGYFKGSNITAEIFLKEALKRKDEIDKKNLKSYLIKLLKNMENLKKQNNKRAAENALPYSALFQNASTALM
jgi:F0F1-type ATP synthase epsilon subunit